MVATKIYSGIFNLAQNYLFTKLHDVKSKAVFVCPFYSKLSVINTKLIGQYSPDCMHKDNHENPAWNMMFWWLLSINTMVLLDLTTWRLVNWYQRFEQICSWRWRQEVYLNGWCPSARYMASHPEPLYTLTSMRIYRVSQEECARLRDSVPYVKVYRYNPKHIYGYGDNGQRKVRSSCGSTYCACSADALRVHQNAQSAKLNQYFNTAGYSCAM